MTAARTPTRSAATASAGSFGPTATARHATAPPDRFHEIFPRHAQAEERVPEQVQRGSAGDDEQLGARELLGRMRDDELVADRRRMIPATSTA
jgi:hypothetical protein